MWSSGFGGIWVTLFSWTVGGGELASPNGQDWRPRFGDAPRGDTGAVGAEERSAEDEP